MSLDQLLHQYNPWWEDGSVSAKLIERPKILSKIYPLLGSPDIVLLTGLRRVGKTTMMKSLIHYLINEDKIDPKHCLYVSMDDYQLAPLSLQEIIDQYRKLFKITYKQQIYVFFDEITYLKDFQIQLKNIYDKGSVKCCASSSSSSVLKDDSAALTGRKRIIEIDPLDFNEYLLFKDVSISGSDKQLLESYFVDYMQTGGMPEYVLRGDREYLVGLIDDIIMKDIVAFYGLKNPGVAREFFILLMERAGKQISINKMANILKISPDTAKRYLAMFEETYLIHLVSKAGKTNETLLSPKKVYATDIGMRNIIVGFRDKGAIFENIVFNKIKSLQPKYVTFDGQEIDFLVKDMLIEVKYGRELEGKQLAAFEKIPEKKKLVVNGFSGLQKLDQVVATTGKA